MVETAQQQLTSLRTQSNMPNHSIDADTEATLKKWETRGRELVDYSRSLSDLVDYEAQQRT